MKGNKKVIDSLVASAPMEAQLAAQYHLDAQSVHHDGLKDIAHKLAKFGEDAEDYLKEIVCAILCFDGKPAYSAGSVETRESITAVFQKALDAEMAISTAYNDYAVTAMEARDDDTRNKFEHLIKWHDQHACWLEKQLRQIAYLSEKDYVSEHI